MRSTRWAPLVSMWLRTGMPILLLTLCAPAAFAQQRAQERISPDYGTTSPILYRVGFTEFVSPTSTKPVFDVAPYGVYAQASTRLIAVPHIPTGALLTRLELDYCDTDASGHRITLRLTDCDATGANCTTIKEFDSNSATCGTKTMGLSSSSYTVQNGDRELIVEVFLTSGDGSNLVNGVNIGYKLQVSPGPGVATFGDVPTTSPIFPFVEAIYAAGITAGCGNGNFCPNSPLTRGQMAVFLSAALGLHFPN